MDNVFQLKDKLYIITGASSGLGREACKFLDLLGAKVIGIARREERLKELQDECKNFDYKVYDFINQEGIKELVDSIVSEYGKVSGMAYFAGVSDISALRSLNMQEAKKVFDINFFSALELIKNLYDKRKSQDLSIVLISSGSQLQSISSMSVYDSSKGALNALVVSLVKDLAKFGGRINSILPAHVETEMTAKAQEIRSEEYNQELERTYPLGIGNCSDVANLTAFLLSPLSRWITGQKISIDGGRGVY
ncbi:hypothetical protein CQA53_03430 [Helicobacter didelphidarum]|uniref:3-oxoacyl-ACP reductase n=1 Tax=Helicobacter didelphidarum TaxID=2040648 RepID=A0A3D8IMJ3_9HELI|nr:SDR family oxidoreductase [Helicobacter didelphidarum]RDU66507.1 hypothetical protein CQA53_03430 [Helicobacter didelphidarum]